MKTIEANLLDFPNGVNMIFHQANTKNVMGAGIAKQIRERYPEAYNVDRDYFAPKGKERLGHYTQAFVSGNDPKHKLVVNLYGQMLNEDSIFGIRTNYFALRDALRSCLRDYIDFFSHYGKPVCGFPWLMSSTRGGGDWKIVESIIEEALEEFNVEGFIVKYQPMSKFLDEPCIDPEAALPIPESDGSNPSLQAYTSRISSQYERCDYSDIDNHPELDKLNKDI